MIDELPTRVSIFQIVEWIVVRNGGKSVADIRPVRARGSYAEVNESDEWVAMCVSDEDARPWDDAAKELLEAIIDARLNILGQEDGLEANPLKPIPSTEFSELHSSPLADTSLDLVLGESRYLDVDDGSILNRAKVFWSGLVALRADVLRLWPAPAIAAKRGRKAAFNWNAIEKKVVDLMDYHDEFSPDDPEWNAQARLETAIIEWCETQFGIAPAIPTLRPKLAPTLEKWRKNKTVGK